MWSLLSKVKRSMRKKLLIIISFFFIGSSFGQQGFYEYSFGTLGSDKSKAILQYRDSTIYLIGYAYNVESNNNQITLHKLDKKGNLLWSRYYESLFNQYAFSINPTLDGNLIICGEAGTPLNNLDIIVLKLDTSGTVIWQKIFGDYLNESAAYIEQTIDSGYILCGFKNDVYHSNDIYIAKLNADGEVIWDEMIGGADNDVGSMILQLPKGGFILTSDTRRAGDIDYDVHIAELDENGKIIWDRIYGDDFQNGCQGILKTMDGCYLSYGETEIYTYSPFDFFIEKIDSVGNSLWKKVFGGTGFDAVFSMVETKEGDFVGTGYSSLEGEPHDLVVFKTDRQGELIWLNRYGGAGIDIGSDIKKGFGDVFIVTGFISNETEDNFILLIHDSLMVGEKLTTQESSFSIFPNPALEYINILSDIIPFNWEIYSINGKLIEAGIAESNLAHISLEKVQSNGVYIIKVKNHNESIIKKVIKSK